MQEECELYTNMKMCKTTSTGFGKEFPMTIL